VRRPQPGPCMQPQETSFEERAKGWMTSLEIDQHWDLGRVVPEARTSHSRISVATRTLYYYNWADWV
jgi:hypothetical protein